MEFYLNTKYDHEQLNAVLADHQAGATIAAAAKANGVTYSPAWQYCTWVAKVAAGTVTDLRGMPQADQAKAVAKLRNAGNSWGEVATTVCLNENACRKLFEAATNVQAVGTRIGKGGRHWGDEQGAPLYAAERQATGVAVEPGTTLAGAVASTNVDPATMRMPALKAGIRAMGGTVPTKANKATLVAMYTELANG